MRPFEMNGSESILDHLPPIKLPSSPGYFSSFINFSKRKTSNPYHAERNDEQLCPIICIMLSTNLLPQVKNIQNAPPPNKTRNIFKFNLKLRDQIASINVLVLSKELTIT
jgi:hypothetical protein